MLEIGSGGYNTVLAAELVGHAGSVEHLGFSTQVLPLPISMSTRMSSRRPAVKKVGGGPGVLDVWYGCQKSEATIDQSLASSTAQLLRGPLRLRTVIPWASISTPA